MRKFFLLFIFLMGTLTTTQLVIADFLVANGSATEDAWVIYSTWRPANNDWPAGFRTLGWYQIEPGGTQNLFVPANNEVLYIRVEDPYGREVKPLDHDTRESFPFWIHPSKAFVAVEDTDGKFLASDRGRLSLAGVDLYEYDNGGLHVITATPECDLIQSLPDLPAQQIYDQAIDSVVWIDTFDGHGSGVLIDEERQLVATNAHVTDGHAWVDIYFPARDLDGDLIRDQELYRNNYGELERLGYATQGRVIAEDVVDDVAIIQLNQLSPTTREIDHDLSEQVEVGMRRGDKVHILGNPGGRLWNWTQGTFLKASEACLLDGGDCLEMEGDAEGGNSGGPILNGQGVLIGILAEGTDETGAFAAPIESIKTLLDTVVPKHTFRIRNGANFFVPYQIKWSDNHSWEQQSLDVGESRYYWWSDENVPTSYPKIRFDNIAGDGQITYKNYTLQTFLRYFGNNYKRHVSPDDAEKYVFGYNINTRTLDIYIDDAAAAPTLSEEAIPTETLLLPNYPNPFNPETWMPYKLSKPAEVTVTIYTADGRVVRTLVLGYQPVGVYQSKSRAAYWDGKNELGEPVASGLYFYTLKAGEFTATRKMLIRK